MAPAEAPSAALALRHHLPGRRLRHQERPAQVDAQHAVELVDAKLEERRIVEDAGVVHQHIDAAEGLEGGGQRVVDVAGLADIAGDIDGLAAARLDGPRHLGPRPGVHVAQRHGRALAGKPRGACAPDALRGTRDDRNLAGQEHGASNGDLAVGPNLWSPARAFKRFGGSPLAATCFSVEPYRRGSDPAAGPRFTAAPARPGMATRSEAASATRRWTAPARAGWRRGHTRPPAWSCRCWPRPGLSAAG